jgi:hypothetical protein
MGPRRTLGETGCVIVAIWRIKRSVGESPILSFRLPSLGKYAILFPLLVNCTRPIRDLIVALLFRQAFSVLHGLQGLETPAYHGLHFQPGNDSCECGNGAPLAGSVRSLDGVFSPSPD